MLKQILSIVMLVGVMAAPIAAQAEIIDRTTIRPTHHHVHKHHTYKHTKHHSYKHHHRAKHHHAYKGSHHRTTSLPARPNDRPNM